MRADCDCLGWALVVGALLACSPAQATEGVTVAAVPGGGQPVVAKCDPSGTIHLLFVAQDGPQYVRSTDNGRTFSQPLAVVDRQRQPPGLIFEGSDMAVDKAGRVHVALSTNAWKLKLPKEEWGFFYARLAAGAEGFEAVRNINRTPSEGFSLAADDQGNVTACWLSGKLYANVSHDAGQTFGPPVEIDPAFDPCDCCTTSAAYAADGRLAVLYREETNHDRDMFLVLWDQAKHQVSRTPVSTTSWKIEGCPMSYYSIVPHGDGFAAVWPTKEQVYLARLDADGRLQAPGEIKTPGLSGMRSGLLTLTDAGGATLVAWKRDEQLGWQLYDKEGSPSGPAGSVGSAGSGTAGVLTQDGRFVLFQ